MPRVFELGKELLERQDDFVDQVEQPQLSFQTHELPAIPIDGPLDDFRRDDPGVARAQHAIGRLDCLVDEPGGLDRFDRQMKQGRAGRLLDPRVGELLLRAARLVGVLLAEGGVRFGNFRTIGRLDPLTDPELRFQIGKREIRQGRNNPENRATAHRVASFAL